jgi:hypothetical protein
MAEGRGVNRDHGVADLGQLQKSAQGSVRPREYASRTQHAPRLCEQLILKSYGRHVVQHRE